MQQINLYNHLTKPSPYDINTKQAILILLAWCSLLAIFSISQFIYYGSEAIYLKHLENKEKNMAQLLQNLLQTSPNIQQTNHLKDQIKNYKQQAVQQATLIKDLTTYSSSGAPTFKPSVYFKSFAEAIVPNVWLTSINVAEQGSQVNLQGFTMSAAQLTKFVTALQHEPPFTSIAFKNIAVDTTEKSQHLAFTLKTQDKKP